MIEQPPALEPLGNSSNGHPRAHRPIAAVVLLGGAVRPTKFNTAVGRPLLDLPCRDNHTLLDEWCDQVAALGNGTGPVPLRILSDKTVTEFHKIANGRQTRAIPVHYEQDPSQLRGTGGVLRDISTSFKPDDLLLVANAGQLLLRPLVHLVQELEALDADIALLSHADGTPTTLMLIRCGCLKAVPEIGFVDMKEQALPLLTKTHDVRVLTAKTPVTLGLRTATSYLAGLRVLHTTAGESARTHWRSTFSVVEQGATIGEGARIHDSVILKGASIPAEAVIVRSVICEGAVIPRGEYVIEKLVSKSGTLNAAEA